MKKIFLIAAGIVAINTAQAQNQTTTTPSGTLAPQPTAQPVAPPPPSDAQIAPGQPAPIQPSTQTNAQMLQQRANTPQGTQTNTTTQPNLQQKYQVDPNSTGTPTNTNSPVINNTRPTNNTQNTPVRVGNLQGTNSIQTGPDGKVNSSSTTIQLDK